MAGGGALSAGTVSLGVRGDASGFGKKLSSDIKAQGSIFSELGKHMGGLITAGLGAAGVAVGIGEVLKTGIEEYSISDKLNAQFAAGIKSTGNAANLSVKSMDELAASIAGYSGQTYAAVGGAEQILQTFSNIKNVGPDKIFDETTVAAANMAAKMGVDASMAAKQLGMALNDPSKGMTRLTRAGVTFTAAQTKQIKGMQASGDLMGAQKMILEQLTEKFGGAAKAAGETLPGQLARSKVAFGELSKTVVSDVLPMVLPAIQWITDSLTKATPWVEEFAKSFSKDLKVAVTDMKPYLVDLGDAAKAFGTFLTGTLIPDIKNVVTWIDKNKDTVRDIALVIGTILLPVFADLAVKEVASGITSVATWLTKSTAATTGAATEFAAHYLVVAGWVASAGAAIASGAETVAIWAMYKAESLAGAATTVGGLLVVAGGWIASAATATASGIAMAAAWVIGLGPVAWIIGAIIAVGAAFVVLYNKVSWFHDGVNAAWNGIKVGFSAVKDWLISAWNDTVSFFTGIPGRIGQIFGGIGSLITAPFKAAFNGVANLWNGTVATLGFTVPSWVPGIGGKGFSLPRLPTLAQGATILPTPGGTVVRVAEAGKAESVVDTGKLNNLLDKVGNGGGPQVVNNIYEATNAQATAYQVTRLQIARGV